MNSEEPLMYSQFCYYIQKDEEKRRATMHIPRKPGEQIEVDWAGDPAHIIDPDTGEITDIPDFINRSHKSLFLVKILKLLYSSSSAKTISNNMFWL